MNTTGILTASRYTKLLGDVRRIIQAGRARAARAANQELVTTYWEIGRRLSQEHLSGNAGYGESVMFDLAEELDVDYTTLTRAVLFFKAYNIAPGGNNLTWSHYRELLTITDIQERRWYEQKAAKGNLTRKQLVEWIKRGAYQDKGTSPTGQKLTRPTKATYVYKARVERVVDGDTLLLRIDLGFQVWKEQRIRLAGIDTPPIDEPAGRKAFVYVRDQMAKAPFVMVKTNKIDMYGRYIGHIFYSFQEKAKDKIFEQGRYLNQELIDKGLARLF